MKTKESTRKGKEKVESSKGGSKRTRKELNVEENHEEDPDFDPMHEDGGEEEINNNSEQGVADFQWDVDGLPKWKPKTRRLTTFPKKFQALMYKKQLNLSSQGKSKLFMCEREVSMDDYSRFGVQECFERLGWMASLSSHKESNDEIYMDEIIEWISTLKVKFGKSPATTEFIGYVDNKEVKLTFKIMDKLAKFDTGTMNGAPYVYPKDSEIIAKEAKEDKWMMMIRELFYVPPNTNIASWPLVRKNMFALPRVLLAIVTTNVMPRTSDMDKVRLFDVMIIYALLTGSPALSARHLILWNIWEARERKERMMIPYARLLSKMLKRSGVLGKKPKGVKIIHTPFTIASLCRNTDWMYKKTRTKHCLYLQGSDKFVEAQRSDVESGEEDEDDQVGVGGELPPVSGPRMTGFSPEMEGSPYYRQVQDAVVQARPANFGEWSDSTRLMFDQQSQGLEEARLFRRTMAIQQEFYRNQDFQHQEQIRHEIDWQRGYAPVVRPRPTNWFEPGRPPYDGSQQLPRYPQSTPSVWLSPYQPQPDQSAGSSSNQGAFYMGDVGQSLWESLLGQGQYQPPDYAD